MTDTSIFMTLFLGLIGFLIYIIVIRIVFRVDTTVRNQEATIFLLMKLWEKQGADPKEIEGFKKRYKNK